MSKETIVRLEGISPGPWCPAYRKHKNREECSERRCKYYQNHRVTQVTTEGVDGDAYTENMDAVSVEHAKLGIGREFYKFHEKCEWHCVRYDAPSELMSLPWEMK